MPKKTDVAKLAPRVERFIHEYLIDKNATQAAIRAGYSEKSAGSQAHRMLKNPQISTLLAQKVGKTLNDLNISVERVLKERARLAFFDVRKLLDSTGRPIAIQDLDDDTAAAVAGLKVKDDYSKAEDGERTVSTIIEYKLADKNASLVALEKHLGIYNDGDKGDGVLNIHINLG